MTTLEEKSKGLLDIGEHCYLCNAVDFLPFKCPQCQQTFCSDHRSVVAHSCIEKDTNTIVPPSKPQTPQQQATVYRGKPLGTTPVGKPPNSPSNRANPVASKPLNSATGQASPAAGPTPKKTTQSESDPLSKLKSLWSKKTASFKEKKESKLPVIFKLKKEAQGDASIPIGSRLYFYATREASADRPEKIVPVYYSKDAVIGKVLDQLCSRLDIINRPNSMEQGKRLMLCTDSGSLPFSTKLGQQVKDGATIYVRWVSIN